MTCQFMTRSIVQAGCLLLCIVFARVSAAETKVFPKIAKLELLFTRSANIHGGLTEGPAAAPDGSIYFTDIPFDKDRGMILRFDPKTMQTTVFTDNSGKANGLRFDGNGSLIACEGADYGGRRVSRWDTRRKSSETIADKYHGKRFNSPNDLVLDNNGRIYFTDPRYSGPESRELERRAVYRIDRNGTVHEITHDVEQPNGIALSPDARTLYVVDHNSGAEKVDLNHSEPPPKKGAMKVYAFPLDSDGFVAGTRRTLIDFGSENGCDGMRVDQAGRLFLASRTLKRPGILVLDPTGNEVDFLPTGALDQSEDPPPQGIPSNCEFGRGDEASMLYVTAGQSLYRVRTNTQGFRAEQRKN